ncbi:hypothetical protein A2690_00955 [Candidatus Roizmanbacteria bacterium RIFCSPHIGHO2_01_FULL_39_12b]|uniref:Ribonuclease VapC n=1 Tax=Candidatus Roizmanbacteria bacterium RIFCSPHIGHO2_01_FULL_39_12b TaxID=1802030 RepID=A0A1F7GAS8_9BACT|nr:MAG: hypothetical protein A2690_00955 [Candidatus Roizmanbacteria bacterium RIFCSPHIGHO2_01_FULL_39_12b]OGK47349.1 MAG: hypothetical protein A3B46_02180 [Candidatus Roizmanbacteria bacterium RIFCSPLOWO2_01_FULL_39_19]
MKYILPDTNVIILAFSGQELIADHFRKWIIDKQLIFSTIVIAEFLAGATDEDEKYLNALLSQFPIAPVDLLVAQFGAGYRKKYHYEKTRVLLPDCLIAATAKVNGATIATLDKKDYPMKDVSIIDFNDKT